MMAATEHANGQVRAVTSTVLYEIEPSKTVVVIEVLTGVLAEAGDVTTRIYAADKLRRFGAEAAGAVPALVDALGAEYMRLQHHALVTLRAIGTPEARRAVEEYEASHPGQASAPR